VELIRSAANPDQYTKAVTNCLLMLYATGKQTRHACQNCLTISSTHAQAEKVEQCHHRIAAFFKEVRSIAEQLMTIQSYYRILSLSLVKYLKGSQLQLPDSLPAHA